MKLSEGQKITVYDSTKTELGEGTFIERNFMQAMNMTIYECREHAILAKGDHWLKLNGEMHFVPRVKGS